MLRLVVSLECVYSVSVHRVVRRIGAGRFMLLSCLLDCRRRAACSQKLVVNYGLVERVGQQL